MKLTTKGRSISRVLQHIDSHEKTMPKRDLERNSARDTDAFSVPELTQAQRAFDLATRWIEHHEAELDFR
ncbi:MAG: hypothetical protein U0936_06525 [Planctomycetaceae bacterium]